MIPIEQVARAMYEAWVAERIATGACLPDDYPAWTDIDSEEVACWIAAAQAARDAMQGVM